MDLTVMTYNIRNGLAEDGLNSWQFRKHLVARAIRSEGAHVVGLQEVYWRQRQFLATALPEYEQFGEHRNGGRQGEATLLCYMHERFSLIEGGNVWLSDTPEVAGSKTWGNRCVRMATWARLRRRADGARMLVVNCHLDHEAEEARQRGAAQLRDLVREKAGDDPAVLMGDFNTWPYTAARGILTGELEFDGQRGDLWDAWDIAAESPEDARTFHGWGQGGDVGQRARIDWIMVRPRLDVRRVTRPTHCEQGRVPSDHYPVVASIGIEARSS